ncbi:hypothetical protein FPV16_09665 [Methylobacterium sp. W2]|nr:hypothetical protein [Methylobacterium sp. W2]
MGWLERAFEDLRRIPLSPPAGRGPSPPCRGRGKRRRSRSEGEGARPKEAPSAKPPHRRLPPRRADDRVVAALSPHAGRGECGALVSGR